MAWEVKYFRKRDGTVPAKSFQEALPPKLRAKLLRITQEAAQTEGAIGGGYYEICHSHPGLSETRAKFQKDLGRFVCGRDGNTLILLTGVRKLLGQPTPPALLDEADALLSEYQETKDTV
jgi:hypothetical protein